MGAWLSIGNLIPTSDALCVYDYMQDIHVEERRNSKVVAVHIRSMMCRMTRPGPCGPCSRAANNKTNANRVCELAAKFDSAKLLEAAMESQEREDAVRREIENSDLVQEGGFKMVASWLDLDSIGALHAVVKDSFQRIRNDNRSRQLQRWMDTQLEPLLELSSRTAEERSQYALQKTLAREIRDGTISQTQLNLGSFVLAGKVNDHNIIPGMLLAEYCHQHGLSREHHLAGKESLQILKATWFMAMTHGCDKKSLRSLHMYWKTGHIQKAFAEIAIESSKCSSDNVSVHLPRPCQALCFPGSVKKNAERAQLVIDHAAARGEGKPPTPTYMIFDGSYMAAMQDISSNKTFHDGKLRLIGHNYEGRGLEDPSVLGIETIDKQLRMAMAREKLGADAWLVDKSKLATEMLECWLHSAIADSHEPCLTIASITKKKGGGGDFYLKLLGDVLVEVFAARTFLLGMGADNDTNCQKLCDVMVGVPGFLEDCQKLGIPFFKDLEYLKRELPLVGFDYLVPVCTRPVRDLKEPFFYSRCPGHTLKAGSRALCSPAYVLHLGEMPMMLHHSLQKGLPRRAYHVERAQSDKEGSERISSQNFCEDPASRDCAEPGHLLYSFLLRCMMKPWWSTCLGTMERFICASVPFHFFEGARMLNASRLEPRKHYFAGTTYKCIRRTCVHQILRCLHYPNDWPAYNGQRQMEWFGEMRFEAQRRKGKKVNFSAADFDNAMLADNASQIHEVIRHEYIS